MVWACFKTKNEDHQKIVARPPARRCGRWGPMGPPTFTQPGTQGPLLYPEGAHGAPLRSVSLRRKNSGAEAPEFFLSESVFYGWFPYEEKIHARLRA